MGITGILRRRSSVTLCDHRSHAHCCSFNPSNGRDATHSVRIPDDQGWAQLHPIKRRRCCQRCPRAGRTPWPGTQLHSSNERDAVGGPRWLDTRAERATCRGLRCADFVPRASRSGDAPVRVSVLPDLAQGSRGRHHSEPAPCVSPAPAPRGLLVWRRRTMLKTSLAQRAAGSATPAYP